MNKSVLGVVGCAAALFAVAGCTPEARQDVGQAGANVSQAADKSVEGTKEAAGKAADATADAAKGAAEATKDAAADAAHATEKAVAKTGEAVGDAAHATEKTVAKAGEAVAGAGDALSLTPKVKNAILVDDSITSKDINVDTKADTKTVTLTGSVPTAAMKTKAEGYAKKVVADTKSGYKVVNNLTVGAAKM